MTASCPWSIERLLFEGRDALDTVVPLDIVYASKPPFPLSGPLIAK